MKDCARLLLLGRSNPEHKRTRPKITLNQQISTEFLYESVRICIPGIVPRRRTSVQATSITDNIGAYMYIALHSNIADGLESEPSAGSLCRPSIAAVALRLFT